MPSKTRRGLSFGILAALLLSPVTASVSLASAEPSEQGEEVFLKGMIVSCPRAGQIWGSPSMEEALEQLRGLGVEWIAIHPYARVRRDGSIDHRRAAEVDYLERATQIVRAAGMQLFWKPHLAYWGSFEWRGDIEFGTDEAAWRRFFDGYRRFIVDQARFAQAMGVEVFAVGVEVERTTHREADWRRIIAAVREVYRGKVTYAANWDSLDKVPFWDAVDWIGVHAYFPLSLEDNPNRETLQQGWREPLQQLADLSSMHRDKPILFAEIGYSRSHGAAREPWTPRLEESPRALELRQRLIEVALERIETEPHVRGMFWWKWIPGPDRWDRDFSMKDPEARRALARYWTQPQSPSSEDHTVPSSSPD